MKLFSMLKDFLIAFTLLCGNLVATAQEMPLADDFAHTFTVVAHDQKSGKMAVGVQSYWFAVGNIVPWAKNGVGIVVTQSFTDAKYGVKGLEMLEKGVSPKEILATLLKNDPGAQYRQIAIINVAGEMAIHTGKLCIEEAGHIESRDFTVLGNMLENENVLPAMKTTYERSAKLPLEKRVLETLKAGKKAGGDVRGAQSAALIQISLKKDEANYNLTEIDLRVDDYQHPIEELERLLNLQSGYDFMKLGNEQLALQQPEQALRYYKQAAQEMPDSVEAKFWKAVTMMQATDREEGYKELKKICKKNPNWRKLVLRLKEAEILNLSEKEFATLQRL
ncbi:MAG: DUF1028 domain-containing protein [Bacteroidota bacterium]